MASFRLRQLYEAQNGVCPRCMRRMNPLKKMPVGDHTSAATIDHVMPKKLGGHDHISNMLALCLRCNGLKADAPPNGCDLLWLELVAARLNLVQRYDVPLGWSPPPAKRSTLADKWPIALAIA